MVRRFRSPAAKPGELKVQYGKVYGEEDLFYCHGGEGASKSDARLVSHFLDGVTYIDGLTLRQDLERRGYDITTFKLTIQQEKKSDD